MIPICRLSEIGDPGAREFVLDDNPYSPGGFVVRVGDQVYGYRNVCPHAGRPLNWGPDRFLTPDLRHIVCAGHGAMFELSSGLCVAGACMGASLGKIRVEISDGVVWVATGDSDRGPAKK